MAKQVINNPVIVLAGGTVSSSAAKCTIDVQFDDLDTTSFGSNGWHESINGLGGGTFTVDWHQDYASGGIDGVVWALSTASPGTAAVTVRPAGTAAKGTSSPEYTFTVRVNGWKPIDSAVGDLATVSTTWPITGAVARATA